MLPITTGGGGKTGTESGSANAAEHRYFPGTSTDRPAKKKPKPKPKVKRRTSSSGYKSPFESLKPTKIKTAPIWQGPSAMDMLMTQMPTPKVDYQKEATKIYQPTLDYLNVQDKRVRQRATNNDRDLNAMFTGLANNIQGQDRAINAQYGQARNTVANATKQGVSAVNQNYDQAANEQARMLKQLGIEAAAPDTLQQNTADEAFFKSLLQSSGNAAQTQLTQENVAEQDFNRAQANISRQSGADARANNQLQLGDILGQLAGKKTDLKTTINQQAASMQSAAQEQRLEAQKQAAAALQQDRQFAMQQAGFGLQQQQFGLAQQQFGLQVANAQADDTQSQARLALDTAKFQSGTIDADRNYKLALQKLAQGSNTTQAATDPWGKGAELATKLYGGNQQAAGNAIAAVRDAIAANGEAASTWRNPTDLVRAVLKRNPGANDTTQLTALATYLFQQIYK